MPIYEYQAVDPAATDCRFCSRGFEIYQGIHDLPLKNCPRCKGPIRRIISWCRACVVEGAGASRAVEEKAREYERQGMWSHAAELLDKHSEKMKDPSLKHRAMDNYVKAGYSPNTIESHLKSDSFMKEESK